MIWSIVLSVIGVLGIYLAGKKSKWGWGLGLSAQILWVIFAVTTGQYGFILSALAYGTVYGKNLYQWHREDLTKPEEEVYDDGTYDCSALERVPND